MSRVINLRERIEQQRAEDNGELLVYGSVLYALRDISQEINTVISALAQMNNGRKEPGLRMFDALKRTWPPLELAAISHVISLHAENLGNLARCIEAASEEVNRTLSPGDRLWIYEYVRDLGDYPTESGGTILEKHLNAAIKALEQAANCNAQITTGGAGDQEA